MHKFILSAISWRNDISHRKGTGAGEVWGVRECRRGSGFSQSRRFTYQLPTINYQLPTINHQLSTEELLYPTASEIELSPFWSSLVIKPAKIRRTIQGPW